MGLRLSYYNKNQTKSQYQENQIPNCFKGYYIGICENGHKFLKIMLCGKEWCPVCGQKDGWLHKQRMRRWRNKIEQMEKVGYLVITIPEYLRSFFDTKALNKLRRYWVNKLKREGFKRGLMAWHWASERDPSKWHPHLNILFENGYIPKEVLNKWREDYKKWLSKFLNVNVEVVDIHYQYCKSEAQKRHKLKYITRPTLKYDFVILYFLYKYHAITTWGKFEKEGNTEKENFNCPLCHTKIKWEYIPAGIYTFLEILNNYYYLGNGLYIDGRSIEKEGKIEIKDC